MDDGIITSEMREALWDDDKLTATVVLFKPDSRGNAGKGAHWYGKELLTSPTLKAFEGKVGFVNHSPQHAPDAERKFEDLAFAVEEVFIDRGLPKARVEFFREDIYKIAKRAKKHAGVSMVGDTEVAWGIAPDGARAKIVKSFRDNVRLDLVAQAGAGGHIDWIKESEGGEELMDFSKLTIEELEADESGKALLSSVRESAVTDVRSELDAQKTVVAKLEQEKEAAEAEISKIKESQTPPTDSESIAQLKQGLAAVTEQLLTERRTRLIESRIRESAVPEGAYAILADAMQALSEDKWGALLDAYKPTTAPVQGVPSTSPVRESAAPVNGLGLSRDQIDNAAASWMGLSLEDYRNMDCRISVAK